MMAIICVKNPPPYVQGYLKRFMFEPEVHVFVANLSRRVIDLLWERLTAESLENITDISCGVYTASLVIATSEFEQGFEYHGFNTSRSFENDNILLFGR